MESLHQADLECSSILLIISSPIRHKIMSRYVKFFSGLLTSCSPDVSLMANHDGWNKSSTTVLNLGLIVTETSLNTWSALPQPVFQRTWACPSCGNETSGVLQYLARHQRENNLDNCVKIIHRVSSSHRNIVAPFSLSASTAPTLTTLNMNHMAITRVRK